MSEKGTEPRGENGETFDLDWLSMREPVDHRSRAEGLMVPLRDAWRDRDWRRIVDLGAGAGSNLRYLAPRLGRPQEWVLVDHDAALMSTVDPPLEGVTVKRVVGDLAREGLQAVGGADLVVGAALLDLTSEIWIRSVVDACRQGTLGALFTTSYDGTVAWTREGSSTGEEEQDRRVRGLVNAHQMRDKGLGSAMGPTAATVAYRLFREAGMRTWLVPAPWILGSEDAPLLDSLIDGWVAAAHEQNPQVEAWIGEWAAARKEEVRMGQAKVTVGHLDLLALP
jgi:SAM-dependent methyltransferase